MDCGSWLADVPAGATLQLEQRQGNTAIPDGSWTGFTPISTNGGTIGGTSNIFSTGQTLLQQTLR
jgi:hypothetical protein